MAMIKCNECGSEISDKATACPKCGNPDIAPEVKPEVTAKSLLLQARDNWNADTERKRSQSPSGCGIFMAIVLALLFFFVGLPILMAVFTGAAIF